MAIPFAKLTVLVGAGVAGSILAKEGWLSDVPHLISGAFKIFGKHIQEDKSRSSSAKNKGGDYYLMSQVNSLRQQLRSLQSSGSVTIISESRRGYGASTITVVIIIGAVGYGYIWWKGLKISDMMFVTRSAFTDARNSVANQIDSLSSSVSTTTQHLSSGIDRVECTLNDCLELTAGTKEEVSELCGNLSGFHVEYESVHRAVRTLESKIVKAEGGQDFTTKGIYHLCQFAKKLEDKKPERTHVLRSCTQRPALEHQPIAPISRTGSLPPTASATSEPGTPSTPVESPRVLQSSKTATASNFKDFQGLHTITRSISMKRNSTERDNSEFSNRTPQPQEESSGAGASSSSSSSSSRFGWKLPSLKVLTRSRSSAAED